MQQVLFYIPVINIPIYGYGFMLFCAYVGCTWLASRLARREGYPKAPIQDLTVWLFIFGLIGARLTFIIRYWNRFDQFWQFLAVWDGGLIFYGSIPGAILGYALCYRFQLSGHGVSHWKMADIVAPCLALGLCLGRIGCLLNGCCFGNVACADCAAISFPMSSPPRQVMVERGHQTPAGFLTFGSSTKVQAVEPMSPFAGELLRGDVIEKVNDEAVHDVFELTESLTKGGRRERWLTLDVKGPSGVSRRVGPFAPTTIGLHPTQIYESISMALLLFLLLSYYPYKKRDGSLMVLFMFGYGVHRFLNEMLRTDTEIVAFGMTLSQNISVLVLIAATILAIIVWRRRAPAPTLVESPAQSCGFQD